MSKLTDILANYGGLIASSLGDEYNDRAKFIKTGRGHTEEKKIIALLQAEMLKVIGEDLPMIQPLDNTMDPIQYEGNRLFRKGANWSKGESRHRLREFIGTDNG